jgi:alpha-N-arabinofuranosidase
MVFLKGIAAAVCATSALAADIIVQNSGGNQTGKFGHSYGYGFLHEVNHHHYLRLDATC